MAGLPMEFQLCQCLMPRLAELQRALRVSAFLQREACGECHPGVGSRPLAMAARPPGCALGVHAYKAPAGVPCGARHETEVPMASRARPVRSECPQWPSQPRRSKPCLTASPVRPLESALGVWWPAATAVVPLWAVSHNRGRLDLDAPRQDEPLLHQVQHRKGATMPNDSPRYPHPVPGGHPVQVAPVEGRQHLRVGLICS